MKRILTVTALAVAQLGLVAVAVAPQLSARVAGDSYLMTVAPLDPIDPFRGAYVTLDYPDLRHDESRSFDGGGMGALEDGESGERVHQPGPAGRRLGRQRLVARASRRRALPRVQRPRLADPVRHRELLPAAGRGSRHRGRCSATAQSPRC